MEGARVLNRESLGESEGSHAAGAFEDAQILQRFKRLERGKRRISR